MSILLQVPVILGRARVPPLPACHIRNIPSRTVHSRLELSSWIRSRRENCRVTASKPQSATSAAPAAPSTQAIREEDPDYEHVLVANGTGMQLSFLGTSSDNPTTVRGEGCTALRNLRSVWLFDCGEDTQRSLLTHPYLRPGKIDRIFISCRCPQTVLGLPGVLCTISAARNMDSVSSDIPVHIYGPAGIAEFLRGMLLLSDTFLGMPVIVHELVGRPLGEPERQPRSVNRRAQLWHMALPPDQLNEDGYYDARPQPFRQRARTRSHKAGFDPRANVRPLPLPSPGDPGKQDSDPASFTWTFLCDEEFMVTAFSLPAPEPTWGYVVTESARAGHLDPKRALDLGVQRGAAFTRLKDGFSVVGVGPDGEEIQVDPAQVISPDLPGRKVGIMGCAADTLPAAIHLDAADVLVHPATLAAADREAGGTSGLAGARLAGKLALQAKVQTLLLTGFPSRKPSAAVQDDDVESSACLLQDSQMREAAVRIAKGSNTGGTVLAADEMHAVCVERRAIKPH
ncbi:hypothetical protein WJX74_006080 [Apatococcus lobatus]|uniref:Uncharacterized protein n=1 Tax=Apatococcus lobatus TaxID=904363 RepID=A0AAW1QHX6_9CHLO